MASISGDTMCVIHADRVSAARCPSCHQFYCSECITEHEGKMICAGCLDQLDASSSEAQKKPARVPGAAVLQIVAAAVVVWILFYFFAQTLGDIPDEFHDGTIWE
ncbi:MAG: rhomboid family protein [Verrucomicrobiota bacterium]